MQMTTWEHDKKKKKNSRAKRIDENMNLSYLAYILKCFYISTI